MFGRAEIGGPFETLVGPDGRPLPQPCNETKWQLFMRNLHGAMNFFGRLSWLLDINTEAVHFFITAVLQMFTRSGMLWGELSRFVLRLLGFFSPRQKFTVGEADRNLDNVWRKRNEGDLSPESVQPGPEAQRPDVRWPSDAVTNGPNMFGQAPHYGGGIGLPGVGYGGGINSYHGGFQGPPYGNYGTSGSYHGIYGGGGI